MFFFYGVFSFLPFLTCDSTDVCNQRLDLYDEIQRQTAESAPLSLTETTAHVQRIDCGSGTGPLAHQQGRQFFHKCTIIAQIYSLRISSLYLVDLNCLASVTKEKQNEEQCGHLPPEHCCFNQLNMVYRPAMSYTYCCMPHKELLLDYCLC